MCRYRSHTFESKEPETLEWIDGFDDKDSLLDIGANIGIYSIYAAKRGIRVTAVEPDCLNFALLSQNIRLNSIENLVNAYPFALNASSGIFTLFVNKGDWGTAGNSLGDPIDQDGNKFLATHTQYTYGISCEQLMDLIKYPINHLKIDVDGNEGLILSASAALLSSPLLKSMLIELSPNRPDYTDCIQSINSYGFRLQKVAGANHIFSK